MFNQDLTLEETQKKLLSMERRLAALENFRKDYDHAPYLDRNLDNKSRDILQQEMGKRALDIAWDDFFYYFEAFTSLDGVGDNNGSSSVSVSVASSKLFVQSPSSGATAYAHKKTTFQNILSFDLESRFSSSFDVSYSLGSGEMTDVRAYVGTGVQITGGNDNIIADGLNVSDHYGFYLDDSNLYGVTSDGSSHTTTLLLDDVQHFDLFFVEARHFPNNKVVFYVSDPTPADGTIVVKPLKERGTITSTLPSGRRTSLWEATVKNDNGAAQTREMDVGYFEIAQRRLSR